MAQVIKYETTELSPEDSAAQIMKLVHKYGGTRFEQWWDNGSLAGVRFTIATDHGNVPIRLVAPVGRVADILLEQKPWNTLRRKGEHEYNAWIRERAYAIAWRQLRDFVEQTLLAVETGLYDLTAAFMAGIEIWDPDLGEIVTVQELMASRMAQLPPHSSGALLLTDGS